MAPAYITVRSYRIVYVLGQAALGSIQTPNGGSFSACPQISVEWEDRLTSLAHIPAFDVRWNMQGVGGLFILIFLYFFIFLLPGLLTSPDAVMFVGGFPVPFRWFRSPYFGRCLIRAYV